MSQNQTILQVSQALASRIFDALKEDPQFKAIVASQDQISFLPSKQASKVAKLSVFPYLLFLEAPVRNIPERTAVNGKRLMQTTCSMRYLITPCTGKHEDDLLLIGKVVQTLLAAPMLTSAGAEACNSPTITMNSVSAAEACSLWTALGEPLKLFASFTVSPIIFGTAAFSAFQTEQPAIVEAVKPKVMELYQTVFKAFEQNAEDWKHRNMIQRQYVMMDFSKNTDMSVDTMLMELRVLGERLESSRPVEPCLAALKKLEEYYEHQRSMLKGFEKVQKKRQEGIDAIGRWKDEVTALLKALNA